MSISTKDCVEKIVLWIKDSGKSGVDDTKQSNWKRILKIGNKECGFIRTFFNKVTNDTVDVYSSEDSITNILFKDFNSFPTVPKNKYLFSISIRKSDWDPTNIFEKGSINILIGTVAEWNKHKALSDHYTNAEWAELDPIISAFNLEEICESEFITSGVTVGQLRKKFLDAGFVENKEFIDKMNEKVT
jgi:hypothetical protein